MSCIQIFPQTAPKNQPISGRSRNIGDGESAGKVQTSDYSLTAKLHSRANTNDALFAPNCKPHSPKSHSSKLITVNPGRYTNKDTHVYDSNHSSASSSTVYNSSAGGGIWDNPTTRHCGEATPGRVRHWLPAEGLTTHLQESLM